MRAAIIGALGAALGAFAVLGILDLAHWFGGVGLMTLGGRGAAFVLALLLGALAGAAFDVAKEEPLDA